MRLIYLLALFLLMAELAFALSPSDVLVRSNSSPVLDLSQTSPDVFNSEEFNTSENLTGHYNSSPTNIENVNLYELMANFINSSGGN